MQHDEEKIIQRAQNGDALAFARLHDRYFNVMFRYFFYRIHDRAKAEDLTSDLFIKLIEKIGLFKPGKVPFSAWLYTVARHMLIDEYRRLGSAPEKAVLFDCLPSKKRSPVHQAEHHSDVDCLKRALAYLTEDQREVIITKFIEGRANKEIARLVGKTYNAVRSLQHRALASLKRAMIEEGCYEC